MQRLETITTSHGGAAVESIASSTDQHNQHLATLPPEIVNKTENNFTTSPHDATSKPGSITAKNKSNIRPQEDSLLKQKTFGKPSNLSANITKLSISEQIRHSQMKKKIASSLSTLQGATQSKLHTRQHTIPITTQEGGGGEGVTAPLHRESSSLEELLHPQAEIRVDLVSSPVKKEPLISQSITPDSDHNIIKAAVSNLQIDEDCNVIIEDEQLTKSRDEKSPKGDESGVPK